MDVLPFLVVEGNPGSGKYLVHALAKYQDGVHVVGTLTAAEALLRKTRYAALFLSPDLDAARVGEFLTSMEGALPAVVASATRPLLVPPPSPKRDFSGALRVLPAPARPPGPGALSHGSAG